MVEIERGYRGLERAARQTDGNAGGEFEPRCHDCRGCQRCKRRAVHLGNGDPGKAAVFQLFDGGCEIRLKRRNHKRPVFSIHRWPSSLQPITQAILISSVSVAHARSPFDLNARRRKRSSRALGVGCPRPAKSEDTERALCGVFLAPDSKRLPHPVPVGGVGLVEMGELLVDNGRRDPLHRLGNIAEEALFLGVIKQAEEVPGLGVVVIARAVKIAVGVARNLQRRLAPTAVLLWPAKAVGLVVRIGVAMLGFKKRIAPSLW